MNERLEKLKIELAENYINCEVDYHLKSISNENHDVGVIETKSFNEGFTAAVGHIQKNPKDLYEDGGCSQCGYIILADTEDWENPICHDCYWIYEKGLSDGKKENLDTNWVDGAKLINELAPQIPEHTWMRNISKLEKENERLKTALMEIDAQPDCPLDEDCYTPSEIPLIKIARDALGKRDG